MMLRTTSKMINIGSKTGFTVKIFTIVFVSLPLLGACRQEQSTSLNCLPESRQLTDSIDVDGGGGTLIITTIADRLREFKASCTNNQLVDGEGREIRFYDNFVGCQDPRFSEKVLQEKTNQYRALTAKYRVIVVNHCDRNGSPLSDIPLP